ncbi:MAG: nucleotidyltransferase substrate binding protein [Deltaproteobacteria bacterium]|nr:nucleotidyltransferase substrate binding protein [Deltaproteobacteria bacterium]
MNLDLSSLRNAVDSLQRALNVSQDESAMARLSQDQRETIRAGTIQNFEFTYELCWKFMKRWIQINVSPFTGEGVARRELFRLSAEQCLITDIECWMGFHAARNRTSPTYNREVAQETFEIAIPFHPQAAALLDALEQRNDSPKS